IITTVAKKSTYSRRWSGMFSISMGQELLCVRDRLAELPQFLFSQPAPFLQGFQLLGREEDTLLHLLVQFLGPLQVEDGSQSRAEDVRLGDGGRRDGLEEYQGQIVAQGTLLGAEHIVLVAHGAIRPFSQNAL